jgi:hypothetical protein
MRNLVRWRNRKETGTFSGRERLRSGHTIMMLKGSRTIIIDAVYQATPKQFSDWVRYVYEIELDPEMDLKPVQRLELLDTLVPRRDPRNSETQNRSNSSSG